MPEVVKNWKEALFMGYFGPIGCGAIYYLEFARQLFPKIGEGDEEQDHLVRLIEPVVTWLVLFSIVVHGLSIPALALIYKFWGVKLFIRRGELQHALRIFQPSFLPDFSAFAA